MEFQPCLFLPDDSHRLQQPPREKNHPALPCQSLCQSVPNSTHVPCRLCSIPCNNYRRRGSPAIINTIHFWILIWTRMTLQKMETFSIKDPAQAQRQRWARSRKSKSVSSSSLRCHWRSFSTPIFFIKRALLSLMPSHSHPDKSDVADSIQYLAEFKVNIKLRVYKYTCIQYTWSQTHSKY